MVSISELEQASAEQGVAVAALKKKGADKNEVDAAVAELLNRKAALKTALEEAVAGAQAARPPAQTCSS